LLLQQLPDRSFADASFRAALYLFRQPFVLVPGLLASFGWGWILLAPIIQNGRVSLDAVAMVVGLALLCGFGVGALVGLSAFLAYQFFTNPIPKMAPRDGETTIEVLRANHFLGDEGRGGKLYVTSTRLAFLPHRLNVQLARVELPYDEVVLVGWRQIVRAGNVLGTTLEIETHERADVFVVKNDRAVAERIASLVE
jgi:hypothetical protein